MELSIYHNGNDWVVAESPADAEIVYCGWLGCPTDEGEEFGWERLDVGKVDPFTITHDCLPDELKSEELPEGAKIEAASRGTDVTATVEAWVAHNGRGYLCGLDW